MYVVLILNKYKYSKHWNGFTISTSCGGTRTEAIDTMKFGSCSARSGWTVCWSGAGLGVYYIYMNEHLYKYLDEMLLQFTVIINDRDEYPNAFWFCSSVIDSSKEKYFFSFYFFFINWYLNIASWNFFLMNWVHKKFILRSIFINF